MSSTPSGLRFERSTSMASAAKTSTTTTSARRRLPTRRPPTHPGEMLLEEFLKPLGITQMDAAARMGVPFQRMNTLVKGRRDGGYRAAPGRADRDGRRVLDGAAGRL